MKYCIDCGCIMPDDHIGDMCECCRDDRGDTIPDGLRREESLYPKVYMTTSGSVREALDESLEKRLVPLVESDLADMSADWPKSPPFILRSYARFIYER